MPDIDLKPTESMAANAERGLALRAEYGRGGTDIGVARARDIKNRKNLSPSTVRRMHSYFSRHEVDKKGKGWESGSEGYPSAGLIAWLLWGGDSGRSWAERKVNALNNKKDNAMVGNKSSTSSNRQGTKEWFAHPSWSEGMLGKQTAPQLAAYSWISKNMDFIGGKTAMLLADLAAGVHANNSSLSIAQAVLAAAKDMVKKGVATRELREWAANGGKFSRAGAKEVSARGVKINFPLFNEIAQAAIFGDTISESKLKKADAVVDQLRAKAKQEPAWATQYLSYASELARNIKACRKINGKSKNALGDACWDGYEAVGTKKKDGKTVPNCVPMSRRGMTFAQQIAFDVEARKRK